MISRGDVIGAEASPFVLHFKVKQRTGKWTDVWYNKENQEWECNAVNGDWGCVMFQGDKSKPFCSHTLAAQLYLERIKGQKDEKDQRN